MFSVVIQAGGESRRMGKDKALLPFLGKPLINRVLTRLSPIADEILVTTNNIIDYAFLQVPLYEDVIPGMGALGGLLTALTFARFKYVAVVACDMPFVNPDILILAYDLISSHEVDVVVPHTGEGYEPFHAIYRKDTCMPAVKQALISGERKLISWFPSVKMSTLNQEQLLLLDPNRVAFWNVNTPEELIQAEKLASSIG